MLNRLLKILDKNAKANWLSILKNLTKSNNNFKMEKLQQNKLNKLPTRKIILSQYGSKLFSVIIKLMKMCI